MVIKWLDCIMRKLLPNELSCMDLHLLPGLCWHDLTERIQRQLREMCMTLKYLLSWYIRKTVKGSLTHLCQKLSKFQKYICQNQRGHRVSVTPFGLFSLWLYWSGQTRLNSILHLFLIFFPIWHLVTFPNLHFKAVIQLFGSKSYAKRLWRNNVM